MKNKSVLLLLGALTISSDPTVEAIKVNTKKLSNQEFLYTLMSSDI